MGEERSISSLFWELYLGTGSVEDRVSRLREAWAGLLKDVDEMEEKGVLRRVRTLGEIAQNELASLSTQASKLATTAGQLVEQSAKLLG